ncbi:fumarylacetoacetase, partial [Tepidicaulis marinus]
QGGKDVIALPDGTARGWLQDGDEVIIGATAMGADGTRLSFGTLTGRVAPAV